MLDDATITEFAQALVPEAFSRRHDAYRVEVVARPPAGRDAYDAWVAALVPAMIADRYPAGHRPVRIVVVEGSDGVRWRWDGSPCCPPAWHVDGVRRQAASIPEPWLFAIELPWPEPVYEEWDDEAGMEIWHDPPVWRGTRWRAVWYAEGRGRGVADVRAGAVELDYDPAGDRDRELGRVALDPRAGLPKVFHRTLHGHPARAAHRLR